MTKPIRLIFAAALLFAAGCATIAPALTQLAIAFGQDLIAAASVNQTPRYALQVEQLLVALTQQTTGLQVQGQLAASGYQPPPRRFEQNPPSASSSGYQYAGNDPYADPAYADQTPADPGYAEPVYADSDYTDPGYADPNYADPGYTDPGYTDPNYADATYADATYADTTYVDQSYNDQTYAGQTYADSTDQSLDYATPQYATRGIQPITLEVALLARRSGAATLEPIDNGADLFDGGSNPSAGDLLKVHFQTNCSCYVYVIGVDATGYIAQIFPDPDGGPGNPVTPGTAHLVPAGDDWWGLDAHKGVEQVFLYASFEPRGDIEQILQELAAQPRKVESTFRAVQQPAIIPPIRGLVKVKARPIAVQTSITQPQTINPTLFTTEAPTEGVAVTRWFNHK